MTTKFYTTQFDPHWLLNAANLPYGEYLNMPTANGKTRTQTALIDVIDAESYDYLYREMPEFVTAIQTDLNAGRKPDQIYQHASMLLGPDREALARRIWQAARHLARQAG